MRLLIETIASHIAPFRQYCASGFLPGTTPLPKTVPLWETSPERARVPQKFRVSSSLQDGSLVSGCALESTVLLKETSFPLNPSPWGGQTGSIRFPNFLHVFPKTLGRLLAGWLFFPRRLSFHGRDVLAPGIPTTGHTVFLYPCTQKSPIAASVNLNSFPAPLSLIPCRLRSLSLIDGSPISTASVGNLSSHLLLGDISFESARRMYQEVTTGRNAPVSRMAVNAEAILRPLITAVRRSASSVPKDPGTRPPAH